MPSVRPNGAPNNIRFSTEPRRALLTPSPSPSVGPDRPPTKRPRLRSTPSSSISATPSASNESNSSSDVNSARRASTLRVLNVWAQLAERYNKRLDEDDIVDLHSGAIIKDRGVVKGASRDYHIGHFAQPEGEQDYPDADQDQEDSEQDDDDGELSVLPPSETVTDDDAPISKTELLRGVPPLSATTDAEDLREFLEAEKKRRELAGDEEDEDDISPEQLAALRKTLEERAQQKEAASAEQAQETPNAENPSEGDADSTPTCPSTRVQLSDDESEDELAPWAHDESTAVYPVARDESEQDVREVEQEIIELAETETDSDKEFEAILTHPPSFGLVSPIPVPQPKKEAQQPLQSPPNSERGRSKSRARPHSRKPPTAEVASESENRPRPPVVLRKPEVVLTRKINTALGSRGRKRKRIASSTSDNPLVHSPAEAKSSTRGHRSMSPSSIRPLQPDASRPILDRELSKPARVEYTVAGPSPSTSLYASAPKIRQPTCSTPTYRSLGPESVQSSPCSHSSTRALLPDPPIPLTYPYSQRHPSHPLSIFSSPDQGTTSAPHSGHPPPPLDPAQAQQAHYLLAQAMHQLSYLLSATMPSYPSYTPNPGQSWHPSPLPPHAVHSSPIHYTPHFHDTRPYHTPSSMSRSGLPPSSPVRSSVSPPVEDQRARERSKSRGRRVSFKLDREEVGSRDYDVQPEFHHSAHKTLKQTPEVKRDKQKGNGVREFDHSLRLESRINPPHEAPRGRTPGPPNLKKVDAPRVRSLSRR